MLGIAYRAAVRGRVRRLWEQVGRGDYSAAVGLAAPELRFRFVGEPPIGVELRGPVAFERWFADMNRTIPGMLLRLTDVVVAGWPWRTTVVVRLSISATLADGTPYRNEGIQWARLRWGRMVSDEVLEDTARLEKALARQEAASATGRVRTD